MNQLDYSGFELSAQTKQLLTDWQEATEHLKYAKEKELYFRQKIVSTFVPNPQEGLNKVTGADFQIDVTQPMNVKIDDTALLSVMEQMPQGFKAAGVLINWKPALVKSGYDALPEEHKKIFDQALTIEPGTPQLKVKLLSEDGSIPEGKIMLTGNLPVFQNAPSDAQDQAVPKAKRGRKPKAK